jgi:hypothetical protein
MFTLQFKNTGFIILHALSLSTFLSPKQSYAQTDSLRFKLVESLTQDIYKNYLNADIAKAMCDTIKHKLSAGRYDTTLNLDEFVYEINKDLIKVSLDNHISVWPSHFRPVNPYPSIKERYYSIKRSNRIGKRAYKKAKRSSGKYYASITNDMFTYGEIKILPGNIGYVEIKDFNNTSFIKKENRNRISLNEVFNFLHNTNSIIIDLRNNVGGCVFLSARLCSYFSDTANAYFITTESVLRYDSNEIRKEVVYKQKFTTSSDISNKLVGSKKVFILTSKRTFSAGELTAYKLKRLHSNTTIIGEKTIGGGNAYYGNTVTQYYTAVIPCAKQFDENNANNNLEAKGVRPDIETTADSALSIAYRLSLPANIDTVRSPTRYYKKIKLVFDDREKNFIKYFDTYVGGYRKITIIKEGDKLFMIYGLFSKQLLIPDAIDFFLTHDFAFIRFERNAENKITGIQVKHKDGYLEKFRRE